MCSLPLREESGINPKGKLTKTPRIRGLKGWCRKETREWKNISRSLKKGEILKGKMS